MTTPIVLTSPEDLDRVLRQLPEDGKPVIADSALERTGLSMPRRWGALGKLCTEGRAKCWREGGAQWARRTV